MTTRITESDVLVRIKRAVLAGRYTKGKFVKEAGLDTYYFLVSSKRAT